MNTLVLHGAMAERFGESFTMDCRTPAEAIHAVCVQIQGFRDAVRAGSFYMYRESKAGGVFSLDELTLTLGLSNSTIHLVPEVDGAGSGKGIGKILVGIAIIGLQFIPGVNVALDAAIFSTGGLTWGAMATSLGIGLILGGAAMLIAPQPKLNVGTANTQDNNSYVFSGGIQSSGQNIPIPLVYGRMRIPAIPVATAIETNQVYVPVGQTYNNPWDGFIGNEPT